MRHCDVFMVVAVVISGLSIGYLNGRFDLTSTETFLLASIAGTAICVTGLRGIEHRSR